MQAGRDLDKMKEMVEVGKQVATTRKHRLCPQFWIHLCDALSTNCMIS